MDRMGTASGQWSWNVPLEALEAYIQFDLWQNCMFVAGSFILSQLKGIPMGGPISAQLASLYLMSKEMINVNIILYSQQYILSRYRDNIYIFGDAYALAVDLEHIVTCFEGIYDMPLQVEQFDSRAEVLEVVVNLDRANLSLHLKPRTFDLNTLNPTGIVRWPDYWSPNSAPVWTTLVMGLLCKATFWAASLQDCLLNLAIICVELGFKCIPYNLWYSKMYSHWSSLDSHSVACRIRDCYSVGIYIRNNPLCGPLSGQ